MCCTKPKEQPRIGDGGSNPVAINQFLMFFSLLGPHLPEVVLNLVYLSIFSGLAALMSADIARNL